jgi:hypothetical protein
MDLARLEPMPPSQLGEEPATVIETQTKPRHTTLSASPVSDVTYDLMQSLTSKLEAIEAHEMYREDATGDVQRLFDEMLDDDRRHAERLLDALRAELR